MAKRHLTLEEPGWRTGLVINGFGGDRQRRHDA